MGASSIRFDPARAVFLERALKAWEKRPEMTFGQLVLGAVMAACPDHLSQAHMLNMSDRELAEALERYVLLDGPPPPER